MLKFRVSTPGSIGATAKRHVWSKIARRTTV